MIREKKYVTGVNINNMKAFEIIRYFTSIS